MLLYFPEKGVLAEVNSVICTSDVVFICKRDGENERVAEGLPPGYAGKILEAIAKAVGCAAKYGAVVEIHIGSLMAEIAQEGE